MSIRVKVNDPGGGAFVVVPIASQASVAPASVVQGVGADAGPVRRRVVPPSAAERAHMGILARGIVRIFQRLMDRALLGGP